MVNYKSKYLKYKLKYLSINGGMGFDVIPQYNLENFQNNLEKLNKNIKIKNNLLQKKPLFLIFLKSNSSFLKKIIFISLLN